MPAPVPGARLHAATLGLLAFSPVLVSPASPHGRGSPPDHSMSGAAFHHPHDVISAVALHPDFPAVGTVLAAVPGTINMFLRSENHGYSWQESRCGLKGRQVDDLVFDPEPGQHDRVWAAAGMAGLQVSDDAGRHWRDGPVRGEITMLAACRTEGRTNLLVAGNHSLQLSLDGGESFKEVRVPSQQAHVVAIALTLDVDRHPLVVIGTNDLHVSRSTDFGLNWTGTAVPAMPTSIALSPGFATDHVLLISTWGNGVMYSTDQAATFSPTPFAIPDPFVNHVAVPSDFPRTPLVCAATKDAGLFSSSLALGEWTLSSLRLNKTSQTDNHFRRVRFSPAFPKDPTVVCATFEGLNISDDGGATWMESNVNPTKMSRQIAISNDHVHDQCMFATGYGICGMTSSDSGATWQPALTGVKTMSSYGLAISPRFATDQTAILGVERGLRITHNRGMSWAVVDFPTLTRNLYGVVEDIGFAPSYPESQFLCAVSTDGFFASEDGGNDWRSELIPLRYPKKLVLSVNFAEDGTLFVAGDGMLVSHDRGKTFQETNCPARDITSAFIIGDFASSGEMYVLGRGGGLVHTVDHGTTWKWLQSTLDGFAVTFLVLSPTFQDDGTMFVSTNGGGIFVSHDRGKSFKVLAGCSTGLASVTCLTISPTFASDQTLVAGTFEGFFVSHDAGASWKPSTQVEYYDDARDPWIKASAGWLSRPHRGATNTGMCTTWMKDEALWLPFNGHGIHLHVGRGPAGGGFEVSIDDGPSERVDTFAETDLPSEVLWERRDLPPGFHVMKIRTIGQMNEGSSGSTVQIDGATVDSLRDRSDVPVFAWTHRARRS